MAVTLLVLDDGETYSGIEGASIVILPDEEYDKVQRGEIKLRDAIAIAEIGFLDDA